MGPGTNHAPKEPISQVGFNHSTESKRWGSIIQPRVKVPGNGIDSRSNLTGVLKSNKIYNLTSRIGVT